MLGPRMLLIDRLTFEASNVVWQLTAVVSHAEAVLWSDPQQ